MSMKVDLSSKELTLGYCTGNGPTWKPFDKVFTYGVDVQKDGFGQVDAVIFWGGTDIHSSLYGRQPHITNGASVQMSGRDQFEWKAIKYCVAHDIPLIGVCRGAQLLCAAAGGTLAQHVKNHGSTHQILTNKKELMSVTSSHHQMMNPYTNNVEHELIAWAEPHLSPIYQDEGTKNISDMMKHPEPEIVYFPGIRGLAIQGHPEWAPHSRFADFCNELVVGYLFNSQYKGQVVAC